MNVAITSTAETLIRQLVELGHDDLETLLIDVFIRCTVQS